MNICVYLKKGGRSPSVINRCTKFVSEIRVLLSEKNIGKQLAEVTDQDLANYVSMVKKDSKTKAKGYPLAKSYYYDYISNDEIRELEVSLREEQIDRIHFP